MGFVIIGATLVVLVVYGAMFLAGRLMERATFGKDNMPKTKSPMEMFVGVMQERRHKGI